MNWRNLIDAAREQAGQTQPQAPGRPRQEPLKRAVSSAYYAMFHALCRSNADTLVGTRNDPLTREAWTRTYRALNHQQATRQLRQARQRLPAAAQAFGTVFTSLQNQRHTADYNPQSRFGKDEVIRLLDSAETATDEYMRMPRPDRRAVAVLMLLQDRSSA